MPTIRVDSQVLDYLTGKAGTGESLNDVLRRELWLGDSGQRRGRPRKPADVPANALAADADDGLAALLDRHLPARWRAAPARRAQIMMLVREVLARPAGRSIALREQAARVAVAGRLGIDPNSVLDKCGRQLFGTGGDQLARFHAALESLEAAAGAQPGGRTSY